MDHNTKIPDSFSDLSAQKNPKQELCQRILSGTATLCKKYKKSMHRFVIMPTQLILTCFLSKNPNTRLFAKKLFKSIITIYVVVCNFM